MFTKKSATRTYPLRSIATPEEYERIMRQFQESTAPNFSCFIRDRLLNRPETVLYRSQSADDFLPIAIQLKNELIVAKREFHDAMNRLRGLNDPSAQLNAAHDLEAKVFSFDLKVEEIKKLLIQIHDQWTQE